MNLLFNNDVVEIDNPKVKRVYPKVFKLRFIHEIHQRPSLWDPNDKMYGNSQQNRTHYLELCNIMNNEFKDLDPLDFASSKKLFKNMRDMFKTRFTESRATNAPPKWEYYQALSFLADSFEGDIPSGYEMKMDPLALFHNVFANTTNNGGVDFENSRGRGASNELISNDEQDLSLFPGIIGDDKLSARRLRQEEEERMLRFQTLFNADANDALDEDGGINGDLDESPTKRMRLEDFLEMTESSASTSTPARTPATKANGRKSGVERMSATQSITAEDDEQKTLDILQALAQSTSTASPSTGPSKTSNNPQPSLPPVISFVLDKFNQFYKKSPQLAHEFENELLRIVITFNSKPEEGAE
ncbi:unnamed protein product, partial [Mesorhabditis spiculigera]